MIRRAVDHAHFGQTRDRHCFMGRRPANAESWCHLKNLGSLFYSMLPDLLNS